MNEDLDEMVGELAERTGLSGLTVAVELLALTAAIQERAPELLEGDGDGHVGAINAPLVGPVIVYALDDGHFYMLGPAIAGVPRRLVVTRDRAGRTEWAYLGEDGEPDEWRGQAPPSWKAAQN